MVVSILVATVAAESERARKGQAQGWRVWRVDPLDTLNTHTTRNSQTKETNLHIGNVVCMARALRTTSASGCAAPP